MHLENKQGDRVFGSVWGCDVLFVVLLLTSLSKAGFVECWHKLGWYREWERNGSRFWSVKRRPRAQGEAGHISKETFEYVCWWFDVPCCFSSGMNCKPFARRPCSFLRPYCCQMQRQGKRRPSIWRCREMLGAFHCLEPVRVWSAVSPVSFLSESHQIDLAQKTRQVLLLASSYFQSTLLNHILCPIYSMVWILQL